MRTLRWVVAAAILVAWGAEASAKNIWEERRRRGPYGVAQPPAAATTVEPAAAPAADAVAPSSVEAPAAVDGWPVTTPLEARYDADGDGRLNEAEGDVYLRERAVILRTEGRVTVHTAMERAYDVDGDGMLSGPEAEALLVDLEGY